MCNLRIEMSEMAIINTPWWNESEKGKISFMADVLSQEIIDNNNLVYVAGTFYIYQEGKYTKVNELELCREVKRFIGRKVNPTQVKNVVELMSYELVKNESVFNQNDNYIYTKDKVYIIDFVNTTIKAVKAGPEFYNTNCLSANIVPESSCEKWHIFLNSILPKDEQKILQEIFGNFLVSSLKSQKFFFLKGVANCGKSVILSILEKLIGKESVSHEELQDLNGRFNSANLFGKIANINADISNISMEGTNMLLKLVTGDTIDTELKFQQQKLTFNNKAKLIFSCNQLPKVPSNKTDGFYRRVLIVPFEISIPQSRVNRNLESELLEEMEGILNWALEGLKRLIKNNFFFSESNSTKTELKEYKQSNNSVLDFLNDTDLILDEKGRIPSQELYKTLYRQYIEDSGKKIPLNLNSFTQELETYGKTQGIKIVKKKARIPKTTTNVNMFIGIRKKTQQEIDSDIEVTELIDSMESIFK